MKILRKTLEMINEFKYKHKNNIAIYIDYEENSGCMQLNMRWLNDEKKKMGYSQLLPLLCDETYFLDLLNYILNEVFELALIKNGVSKLLEENENEKD